MEEFRELMSSVSSSFLSLSSEEKRLGIGLLRETMEGAERSFRSHLLLDALPTLTAALGQAEIQSSSWLTSPGYLDSSNADILTNVLYETLRDTESPSLQLPSTHPPPSPLPDSLHPLHLPSTSTDPHSLPPLSPEPAVKERSWHQCPSCPRRFAARRRLHSHRKTHIPAASLFSCALCGRFLNNRSAYSRHLQRRHGRPYSAPRRGYRCHCGFSSNFRQSLYRHRLRVHQNSTLDLRCSLCPQICKTRSALQEHKRYRHSAKVVACPHCPKSFALPKDLNKHLRFCHSESRLHSCGFCEQRFKTGQHLKRHISTIHP